MSTGTRGRPGRLVVLTVLGVLVALLPTTASYAVPPTVDVTSVTPQFLPVGGGEVTITADVTDDGTLTDVHAVITGPAGPQDVAMSPTTGAGRSGTFTVPANTEPRVVSYTVEVVAVDDAGDESRASGPSVVVDPFTGPETEPPVITGVTASPSTVPADGGTVTVSAMVTSSVGVSDVGYVVYLASGPQVPATMTRVGSSDMWQGDVIIPANSGNDAVSHSLEVFAQGNDGGSSQELAGTIDQEGQPVFEQAPVVEVTSVSPTALGPDGGGVTIAATASDDGSVDSVVAVLTGPGAPLSVDLGPTGGVTYAGSLTLPANIARTAVAYAVEVVATDDAGLSSSDTGPPVEVAAALDTGPVVTGSSVAPTALPASGGVVTIATTATDDHTIADVHATVTFPGGRTERVVMPATATPSRYEGRITLPANRRFVPVGYTVEVTAVDDVGQAASEQAGTVTIAARPDAPPTVRDGTISPGVLTGSGPATISARLFDDRSLAAAYAVVQAPGLAPAQVDLVRVAGGPLRRGVFSAPANTTTAPIAYAVTVVGRDGAGQTTQVAIGTLTVNPVAPAPSVVEVDHRRLRFGRVGTGARERRVVEVTHVGPATARRLTLDLRVAGAAFRLGGRYADRDTLRLRPGQIKRLVVVFEPARRGRRTGELRLRRTDGKQAGLSIVLAGRGGRF